MNASELIGLLNAIQLSPPSQQGKDKELSDLKDKTIKALAWLVDEDLLSQDAFDRALPQPPEE